MVSKNVDNPPVIAAEEPISGGVGHMKEVRVCISEFTTNEDRGSIILEDKSTVIAGEHTKYLT